MRIWGLLGHHWGEMGRLSVIKWDVYKNYSCVYLSSDCRFNVT